MSLALHRLGRLLARRPWTALGAWLVVAVLVLGAAAAYGGEFQDSLEVPGVDSQQAAELLTAAGSDRAGLTAQVVLRPRDGVRLAESGPAIEALAQLQTRLAALPNVLGASDPAAVLADGLGAGAESGLVSSDGRVAVVTLQYPAQSALGPEDLTNLQDALAAARPDSPLEIEATGDLYFAFAEAPTGRAELIGLAVAALILLLAFGSLLAMALPIGLAVLGLAVSVGLMTLLARLSDIPSWAPEIGAMVGLGIGIDYALFIVSRHREQLASGLDVQESIGRAMAAAGQPVVFAGGIVVLSILGLSAAGVPFITAGAVAVALLVLVMVTVTVTALPALLGLAGGRVRGRRARAAGAAAVAGGTDHAGGDGSDQAAGGWLRWVGHVCRHPRTYAGGATVLLLALAAPVLWLSSGIPDAGTLPDSRTERRAYDLVTEGFGPGANGQFVLAVDAGKDPLVLADLVSAVRADRGVAAVGPVEAVGSGGVAAISVQPATGPQDAQTYDTLRRLRADVLPTAVGTRDAQVHLGGQTAAFVDSAERITDRLPYFVLAVVLLSFLLLVLVFRSVLVPLKAAVLNLLSIGAAYGVLVLVFQQGWGAGLIGVEQAMPIVSFIPLFMFAIVFGLSMDYEVFLLSRVREEHLAGAPTATAVARGIAKTGRVITSAALIMVSVFLAFVLSDDPTVKMFGLGLATAVLVDATLVRMVLVPATMTLLGAGNWWLPGWLDRLLPHLDLQAGETAIPVEELVVAERQVPVG